MSFSPRSGFTGTAILTSPGASAQELPIVGWNVTASVEVLRYKNSLTGNHPAKATTFSDATFSINIDYDDANQPFSSAGLNLVPGATLTNVKLLLDGSAGTKYWSFPTAFVVGTPQSMVREGKITTSLQCEPTGQWAAPAGVLF
jgi:hypothetical protein